MGSKRAVNDNPSPDYVLMRRLIAERELAL
jgi:hypothetical protein